MKTQPPTRLPRQDYSSRMQVQSLTNRREFLQLTAASLALPGTARLFAQAPAASPLRAVVIGHTGRGDYGHGLETIFENRPGIELRAVADPDEAGRAKIAAKIKAPKSYADYREMLVAEKPALVSMAMRHADQHHAIARACLEAGAHIYCEKPFVVSPEQADDLLALSRQKNLKIAVAHTMRLMPVITRLKQALAQGRFGTLIEMRAYGKQDARAGGEDMMVLGTHLFDLMRLFAGDPLHCAARIQTAGRDITPGDGRLVRDNVGPVAGDHVFAAIAFPGGVNATFTSSGPLRQTVAHWGIELHCSLAVVRVNCDISPNVFVRASSDWTAQGREDSWKPFNAELAGSPPAHNLGPVADWLDAIAKNREPECSGRNAAWAVEMVMAAYHAALGQAVVAFPLSNRAHPLRYPNAAA